MWGVQPFLHNSVVDPVMARAVARLLVGGQGLRGGDCGELEEVTLDNCCLPCLFRGVKAVESLVHVTFTCPEYSRARGGDNMPSLLAQGDDVFLLHRKRWGWRNLKSLRRYFWEVLSIRAAVIGGWRRSHSALQEMAAAR